MNDIISWIIENVTKSEESVNDVEIVLSRTELAYTLLETHLDIKENVSSDEKKILNLLKFLETKN